MRPAAFGDLWRRYSPDVYRFLVYLSGNAALADDLTAETFLRVWTAEAPVRPATVKNYLLAIARNLYLHEVRRSKRLRPLEEAPERATPHPDLGLELAAAMDRLMLLPETDRAALLLGTVEGLSYAEVSQVLGISVAAVKVKVHRARLRLAERTLKSEVKA